MTIAEARNTVRQFARNAASSVYSDADIDRAILAAGGEFCHRTNWLRTTATAAITAGSNAVGALPADFSPDKLIGFYLDQELEVWDHAELLRRRQLDLPQEDTPVAICLVTPTTAELWPTPIANATLTIAYNLGFPTWTPGDAGPSGFLLPEDLFRLVLMDGAVSKLQFADPDSAAYTAAAATRFEALIAANTGASQGPQRSQMKRAMDVRSQLGVGRFLG